MSIQTKEKMIDGRSIKVAQFPARRALQFKARILRLVAPFIGELMRTVGKGGKLSLDTDVPVETIVEAMNKIADVKPEEFVDLCVSLMQCTWIDGKEISESVFDMEFAGNTLLMYKIIWYIVQVNFSDFFAMSGTLQTGNAARVVA